MKLRKIFFVLIAFMIFMTEVSSEVFAKTNEDISTQQPLSNYPPKYDEIYLEQLKKEYKKISNDEVLQVIGNDSEQVLINDFSNTYLIGNSSKLLKSFKINKTSSNNLKGFEKVLRKKLNKR